MKLSENDFEQNIPLRFSYCQTVKLSKQKS